MQLLPLHFCRACGQEFYGMQVDSTAQVTPWTMDEPVEQDRAGYFCPMHTNIEPPIPEHWLTPTGKVRAAIPSKTDLSGRIQKKVGFSLAPAWDVDL